MIVAAAGLTDFIIACVLVRPFYLQQARRRSTPGEPFDKL
jgi:hypothetical protein